MSRDSIIHYNVLIMKNALIGYSGFVGSTLMKQAEFNDLYRSTNIQDIRGNDYNTVVCAGAPAVKWLANKEPDNDRQILADLMSHLDAMTCKQFILISTVDVFKNPNTVSESTPLDYDGLHPYGLHRAELENFVRQRFTNHLIVRLPGLVGPGLKKNIIFDFLNDNMLDNIDSRHVFQFYPMVNLWADIQLALANHLSLLHLTAEPISVAEVAAAGFAKTFINEVVETPLRYDLQSDYAELFGETGNYQYRKKDTVSAIRHYAQSEAKTLL